MANYRIYLVLLFMAFSFAVQGQENSEISSKKMQWFRDAKLGVFIHWGIYAVDGVSESWSFFNNYMSHTDYMKQLDGFSASNYKPKHWAKLIEESGAKYSVITTRHHDGVSLWDSQADHAITTTDYAKAGRDVLSPFISALQKEGLKIGLYYSLPDWSHPHYDVETKTKKRYDIEEDPQRWKKYVDYYQTQLGELSKRYHPDLLWFDGNWEHTNEEWESDSTLALLKKYNPNIIVNSRLNGKGDYDTPEQGIPVVPPESKDWELCYTMNDSWGYQPFDKKYKTPNMIVRSFADVLSMGGNFLVDIGPKADGTIPDKQIEILQDLGRWTSKYKKAIYGTKEGLSFKYYKGKSSLSKDEKTLFLYLGEAKDYVRIHGLRSTINTAKIIGAPEAELTYSKDKYDNMTLKLSNIDFDRDVTVVELDFSESISLRDSVRKPKISLKQVLENADSDKAIYNIADRLHDGVNLLNHSGLTEDGENMQLDSSNTGNPETLKWISKYSEALYHTGKGLPNGPYDGLSALSKDKQTLYLFVEGNPTGPIALKGLKNKIYRVRIVGEGTILGHSVYNKLYWSDVPGIVYIDVPREKLNDHLTVISVLLDGPIELYREKVGAVESNE